MRPVAWFMALSSGVLAGPAVAADLVAYQVRDDAIPKPLTDQPGVATRGQAIVRDPARGNCMICHPMPIAGAAFHGDVGPDLAGIGARYDAGQLRLRVVDPKRLNPESVMPAYYRVAGLYQVLDQYRDEPILTAQEIEDVVAYLGTLVTEP